MSILPLQPIVGAAYPHHPPNRVYMCAHCGDTFNSADALRNHKKQKVDQEGEEDKFLTHVYCCLCDLDFGSRDAGRAHWNQNHAQKQNIDCPGCAAHFAKFSGFVRHIEFNLCPVISQQTAAAADRCKMSLDFVKGLEERDRESAYPSRPKDFSRFLRDEREPAELMERVSWTGAQSNPWDNQRVEGWAPPGFDASDRSDVSRMTHRKYLDGNTRMPDLLTGDDLGRIDGKQRVNSWALQKKSFSDAPAAQRPDEEQLDQLQGGESFAIMRTYNNFQFDVDDPSSPQFSADQYFNPYTKKYGCPKCRAGKSSYNTKSALVHHLRSPAHKFEKEVSCPSCLGTFKSLYALAAHCEAEGKKCNFRHSEMYGMFLQQLTWNLIEVTGEHKEDGTKKYDITQKAKEDYGVVKSTQVQPSFGHRQVYDSKSPTKCLRQDGVPQRINHQHQQAMSASGAPWQSLQDYFPELMSNSSYDQVATSRNADRSMSFFVDGPAQHVQHKQQRQHVDEARWQNMQTQKSQARAQQQAQQAQQAQQLMKDITWQAAPRQMPQSHNQSQAQQQQQQRGNTMGNGPLTADALSKFNIQQAKNTRFQLDDERKDDSTAWSQDPGSWGLDDNSDGDDGYQGW